MVELMYAATVVGLFCGALLIGDLISLAVLRILKKRNW